MLESPDLFVPTPRELRDIQAARPARRRAREWTRSRGLSSARAVSLLIIRPVIIRDGAVVCGRARVALRVQPPPRGPRPTPPLEPLSTRPWSHYQPAPPETGGGQAAPPRSEAPCWRAPAEARGHRVKQLAAAHSLVRYGMRRGNDRGGGRGTLRPPPAPDSEAGRSWRAGDRRALCGGRPGDGGARRAAGAAARPRRPPTPLLQGDARVQGRAGPPPPLRT